MRKRNVCLGTTFSRGVANVSDHLANTPIPPGKQFKYVETAAQGAKSAKKRRNLHRSQEKIIIILSGDQDGGIIRYRGLRGEEQTLRSLER